MLLILKTRADQSHPINAKELASLLETNPRNIREYKKELITAGYNIQEVKGRYGGYYLDERCLFPALCLTQKEEQALAEGRSLLATQQFEKKESFEQAMNKVLNSSKDRKINYPIFMNEANVQMSTHEKEMVQITQKALETNSCLSLCYQSRRQTFSETYLVDPYEIIHYHDAYYLLGFNHVRKDYRIYRFSDERMKSCTQSPQTFLRDSNFHVEQYIGKNSLIKGAFQRVYVSVKRNLLPPFKEVYWGLDFRQEDSSTFSFLVEDFYLLYRQLFSFGKDVKIIAPESIVEEYKSRLSSTLRNYD